MDSAWRHPVWLPHSSLGFQGPVGTQTDATIAQSVIVACMDKTNLAYVATVLISINFSTLAMTHSAMCCGDVKLL